MIVFIDGPAGSGKTTLIKNLEKHLGWAVYPTGLITRSVAKHLLDNPHFTPLEAAHDFHKNFEFGQPLAKDLHNSEISLAATQLSQYPQLKENALKTQNRIIHEFMDNGKSLILDGSFGQYPKDFSPPALHFFVDASLETRAQRRAQDYYGDKWPNHLDKTHQSLAIRDDMDRRNIPWRYAPNPDSFVLDTDKMSAKQVYNKALDTIIKISARHMTMPISSKAERADHDNKKPPLHYRY